MNFRFGMVVGMDYLPNLRLMLVAPVAGITGIRAAPGNWWAVVLRDMGTDSWNPTERISVNPLNTGITIIEEEAE